MTYNYNQAGQRLKELRLNKGLSLAAVADECGVNQYQTISSWEKGYTKPTLENLFKLCDLYECELGYILGEPGYELKTRKQTDIQAETGLSELAVEKITTLTSQELRFIDDLLKNSEYLFSVSQSYCQYRDVGKIGLASLDGNVHIKHLNKPEWILPANEVVNILKYAFSYEVLRFADRKQEDK